MKKIQLKKITLTILVLTALILTSSFVSAIGVTYPHPQNIELKPGQSSYFSFQIQSDNIPLTCVPIMEETAGLEFAFNQQYDVEANQVYIVKPQIIIPKQTPFGNYKARFCMECIPSTEVAGSVIIPKICNLPITVTIVSERTRENIYEEDVFSLWITLLIIAILILAIIIFYLIKRRKRQLT